MTVNQLSVFIENKSGKLVKVLNLLKEAQIQIVATTIADTIDYGICRIICNNPDRAYNILQQNSVSVACSEAFALQLDNTPGAAADAIQTLADAGIGITYLYSIQLDGKGVLLFRTDDAEKTRSVIQQHQLTTVNNQQLTQMMK